MFSIFLRKAAIVRIAIVGLFIIFSLLLFQKFNQRSGAFGCFDECFNYVAGYFLLKGRVLYSEIFFNHQILMAYLSAIIQKILNPQSIYFLVLEHRLFIFFFGIVMDLLLMWRFGFVGAGFAFLFEATKFYFMGSLFLAESILVYPLVYIFGLLWERLIGKKLTLFDYMISALFTWFIVFLREPAIFIAVFIYALIHIGNIAKRTRFISIGFFTLLTAITLLTVSLPDYITQVFVMNTKIIFSETQAYGNPIIAFLRIFFFPVSILLEGRWTFLREILIGVDIVFLSALLTFLGKSKKKIAAFILIICLGLDNLRIVTPGFTFYEAFHMLPWYGLFVFSALMLLKSLFALNGSKKLGYLLIGLVLVIFIYSVFSPKSFFQEEIDKHNEFHGNFLHYYVYGEAVKNLAKPYDTVFLEQWDDLLYWQTGLDSSYKYAIYAGPQRYFPQFRNERTNMFKENPPDFYYTACSEGIPLFGSLPDFRILDYTQLYYDNQQSCLFIKKDKLSEITADQWEKLKVLRFSKSLE